MKNRQLCPTSHHVSVAKVEQSIKEKILKNQLYGLDDNRNRDDSITARIREAEKRIRELKTLLIRLYEEYVSGKINDDRYEILSSTAEKELKILTMRAEVLKERVEIEASDPEMLSEFVKNYPGGELDYDALKEVLDRIEVSERLKRWYADSPQKVDVIFK